MDAGGSRPSSQQTPARLTNCPRPSTVSVFSSPVLCFHIFLTVLLCLWFLIELPRSDTSSGCYIILSNSAPSARPLSDSHHARASWGTAEYDKSGLYQMGGRAGRARSPGGQNMRWPGVRVTCARA